MKPAILSWSGGKDSALALYFLNKNEFSLKSLFTTISIKYNRVSMHGIRKELLKKQVESIGLPLHLISIPKDVNNEEYGEIMKREMLHFKSKLIKHVVFGDIFLEDIRNYREMNLSKVEMKAVFPLWKKNSRYLAEKFIQLGFKAIITSLDSTLLGKSFIGTSFNNDFLNSIPSKIDPCGENGEFHTFVFDGPIFSEPVPFVKGEIVFRDNRFYYIDLI